MVVINSMNSTQGHGKFWIFEKGSVAYIVRRGMFTCCSFPNACMSFCPDKQSGKVYHYTGSC